MDTNYYEEDQEDRWVEDLGRWRKVTGGVDLLYVYEHGGQFGYGIRIEGAGLVTVTRPDYQTLEEAQGAAEGTYGLPFNDLIALMDKLPRHLAGLGGTPKWV